MCAAAVSARGHRALGVVHFGSDCGLQPQLQLVLPVGGRPHALGSGGSVLSGG
jgi:hypothetical protein